MAADLCREFMGDARVMAALTQRIDGLLALPIDWEDGAKKSARVKKAIVDDFPEGVRECDLFSLYSWGLLLGVAEEGADSEDGAEEAPSLPAGVSVGLFQMAALSEIKKDKLPNGADRGFDRIDAEAGAIQSAAADENEAQMASLAEIVAASGSADDLKRRMDEAFSGMESDEYNALLEKAFILGEIEGRWAAWGDA